MVTNESKAQKERLEELVARAQAAFERSRHLVRESRNIRAEAAARRSAYSTGNVADGHTGASSEFGEASD